MEDQITKCCTKTLSLLSSPIFTSNITVNIITTLYEIMVKHFQHFLFKATQGYFSVWRKVGFSLETERFLPTN